MTVDFRLLGDVEVQIDDHLVEVGHARQRCVLVVLLLDTNRAVPADQLLERVWGRHPPLRARNVLSGYLSRLRQVLAGADAVSINRRAGGYVLSTDPVAVDVHRFHELVATARAVDDADATEKLLAEALRCWRGEPFATLDTPWLNHVREVLEAERFAVELDRIDLALQVGRHAELLTEIAAQAQAYPLDERLAGQLMLALYRCGRQGDALAAFQRTRHRLAEELGADPSPPLRRLHQQILSGEAAPSARPAGRSSRGSSPGTVSRRSPVPPRSSFVGREGDLAGVLQRLAACRLLTVCGTGGVGKTRLALEAASRAAERYPDPVCLVELATLAPGGVVVAAVVASALGVAERAGTSTVDRLVEAIGERRMLLVLDNCEHVLDQAAELVDTLLRRTPAVDVLATSRTPLAIDGEQVWPLVPLAVDEDGAPAVRLFCDRAVAARPGFVLNGENQQVVQRLCRRLDGLPLALELAAARLRVGTLGEVGAAVDERMELLAGARRAGQPRHRSLEALVDWSYRLLDGAEQRLFTRLAVYSGPFSVADAVAVAGGDGLAAEKVQTVLWALVDQSMVAAPDSGARYVLLETLRHYARRRLDADGALLRYRQRHADHVLATAAEAAVDLRGPRAPAGVAVLDRLLPELRAAREHLRATGDDDGLLRLSAALYWYGFTQFHSEVLGWARDAVGRSRDPDAPLLPAVLGAAATAHWQRGDLAQARRLAERGVHLAARLGDPPGASVPFSVLADVMMFVGDVSGSRPLWREARRRAEYPIDLAYGWVGEAMAAAYGDDPAAAPPAADEAIRVAEVSGSPIAIAWSCYAAGEIRLDSEPDAALGFLERALDAAAEVGDRMAFGAAQLSALSLRCREHVEDRDVAAYVEAYHELIQHWLRLGAWLPLWTTVRNLAELLVRCGDERHAARLLGAVAASPTSAPAYGAGARRLDAAAAEARSRLGPEFDAEVAAGRRLGDQAAVALALQATGSGRRHGRASMPMPPAMNR